MIKIKLLYQKISSVQFSSISMFDKVFKETRKNVL